MHCTCNMLLCGTVYRFHGKSDHIHVVCEGSQVENGERALSLAVDPAWFMLQKCLYHTGLGESHRTQTGYCHNDPASKVNYPQCEPKLTLGAHAQRGLRYLVCCMYVSVCVPTTILALQASYTVAEYCRENNHESKIWKRA